MPYSYEQELNRECREQRKRWNGKVISTSRQWNNNHNGSLEVGTCSMDSVWCAVRDYYQSREWE